MKRNNDKDRTIDVKYNPSEVGDYTIHVKWSDRHVPGSPFLVKVVDNRDQLHEVQESFPTFSSTMENRNGWAEEI